MRRADTERQILGWLFVAPAIVLVVVLVLYPMVHGFQQSIESGGFLFGEKPGYVGLRNYKDVLNDDLPMPFPRISYEEAMRRFGSDKPDMRIALELVDVADLVRGCDFKVFSGPASNPKGRVAALRVPKGGTSLSRPRKVRSR